MQRDTFDWASRTCNNTIVLPNLCMLHANMRNRVHASFSHAGDTPSLSTVPPTYLVRPAHVNVSHKCDALLWGPQTTEYLKYCWLHDLNVDLKPSDLDLADRFVPGVICIHCHLGWAPFMGPFVWIIILNWWYNHPTCMNSLLLIQSSNVGPQCHVLREYRCDGYANPGRPLLFGSPSFLN